MNKDYWMLGIDVFIINQYCIENTRDFIEISERKEKTKIWRRLNMNNQFLRQQINYRSFKVLLRIGGCFWMSSLESILCYLLEVCNQFVYLFAILITAHGFFWSTFIPRHFRMWHFSFTIPYWLWFLTRCFPFCPYVWTVFLFRSHIVSRFPVKAFYWNRSLVFYKYFFRGAGRIY